MPGTGQGHNWQVWARRLALGVSMSLCGLPALAEPIRIGAVFSLSGANAVQGRRALDGLRLAVKLKDGRLGDQDIELVVIDDESQPETIAAKLKQQLDTLKLPVIVGSADSDVTMAMVKPASDAEAFLISPGVGEAKLAGSQCSRNVFIMSYQREQPLDVLNLQRSEAAYSKFAVFSFSDAVGERALTAFKRAFNNDVTSVVRAVPTQEKFDSELDAIELLGLQGIAMDLPGANGLRFLEQFRLKGLAGTMGVMMFAPPDDVLPLDKLGLAEGFFSGSNWVLSLDNPENMAFVAAYWQEYGILPDRFAAYAFDAGNLLDGALRRTKGVVSDKAAFRMALRQPEFKSVRGAFAFGNNNFPIQDFYLLRMVKAGDGNFQSAVVKKVLSNFSDSYAPDCPLK